MKNNILLIVMIGIVVFGLTACGGKKEETKKIAEPFTMTCEGEDNSVKGVINDSRATYNFGKDQYVTDYEVITTSIYDSEKKYKTDKEKAEKTAQSTEKPYVIYHVETSDVTRTISFSYFVTITEDALKEKKDKDYYKAAKVLKRVESNSNIKCTFSGVERNQIK